MTSSIRQCTAVKPDGSRCRRTARPESAFSYSHRHYRPRRAHHVFTCEDCERPIPPGESRSDQGEDEKIFLLCEPCFRLRRQIEARILEACSVPGGLPREEIIEDLERFGVPPEMTEATRVRLHSDGRLVYSGRE